MAESIDIKLNVDAGEAEELKRLPREARREWEQLNRELASGPGFAGPRGRRLQEVSGRQEELARIGQTQGFWTPQQKQEFTRGQQESNRLWSDYWKERGQIAQQAGDQIAKQIQELEKQLSDVQRTKGGRSPEGQGLSRQIAGLYQQQAAYTPQAAQAQVRQAQAEQQRLAREMAAAATAIPVANRVSPERQQQAQARIAKEQQRQTDQQARQAEQQARADDKRTQEDLNRANRRTRWEGQQRGQAEKEDDKRTQDDLNRANKRTRWERQQQDQAEKEDDRRTQENLGSFNKQILWARKLRDEQEKRDENNGGVGLGGMAMRFGRGLVGAYSIYAIASKIRRDFASEYERMIAVADIGQRVRPVGMGAGVFQGIAKQLEPSLRPEESTQFLRDYSALTGGMRGAQQAVGLTRGLGLAPEEGAQMFGQVGRMGMDQDKFAKRIAEESANANIRGRMGEMTEALIQMADSLVQRLGRVPDQEGLASMLDSLSATKIPGLQGQYGAAQIMGVDEAFRSKQLFNTPDIGPQMIFSMFARMGISDPTKMLQTQKQGLMAHPELWKPMFEQIDQQGGFNSFLGFQGAQSMGLPANEETFNAMQKALTSPAAPGQAALLKRVLGPEEYGKLSFEKNPQMFEVARKFQEREATGDFANEGDERKQLVEALQKEASEMNSELKTRQSMAQAAQSWTDAIDKGVVGFTHLVSDTLPAFGKELDNITQKIHSTLHPLEGRGISGQDPTSPHSLKPRIEVDPGSPHTLFPGGASSRLPAAVGAAIPPAEIQRLTNKMGLAFHNDPDVIRAILQQESSGWNIDSKGGDIGLMQMKPGTAGMSREDLHDPEKNIRAGNLYYARLHHQFQGMDESIAGYNAGAGGVEKAKARAAKEGGDWRDYLPKGKTAAGEPYDTKKYLEAVKSRIPSFHDRNAGEFLTGSATVYVDIRDKKTGESLAHAKVPVGPTTPITGLSTTSSGVMPGL